VGDAGRSWWIWSLAALLILAGAMAGPIILLSQMLPLARELGQPITSDLALAATFGGLCALGGVYLGVDSLKTRRRERLRRIALHGNLDAIPISRIVPDPDRAPNVSTEPLALAWRATKRMRYVQLPIQGIHALVVVAVLWVSLAGFGVVRFGDGQAPALGTNRLIAIAGLLAVGGILGAMLYVLGRFLPVFLGTRPIGVTASAEGIEQRTLFGNRRFLAWEDMRLLEVSSSGSGSSLLSVRNFKLYGARSRIEWSERPGGSRDFEPDGISTQEMTLRLRSMLDLINARTGLVPRTFTKALQVSKGEAAKEAGDDSAGAWKVSLNLLAFAVFTLGVGAAVVVLPLSTFRALNVALAVSLAAMALVITFAVVWQIATRAMRRQETMPLVAPIAAAPSLGASGVVYAVRYSISPWARLQLALWGVLLLPNLLPVLFVFDFQFAVAGAVPHLLGPWGIVLAFVLAIYGIGGLLLLVLAVRRPYVFRADGQGIGTGAGGHVTFLPWDGVERIVRRARGGRTIAYAVTGDTGRVRLVWQAQPSWSLAITQEPGTLPITPDELASLVARQSGKPIQERTG
jgi:hypothetical protein